MWLLSQYSSQHCGVYIYILALAECSSSSNLSNRHRPLCPYSCPILFLFLVHNYLPLAHNLNSCCHEAEARGDQKVEISDFGDCRHLRGLRSLMHFF
jgi:hypothetical protein